MKEIISTAFCIFIFFAFLKGETINRTKDFSLKIAKSLALLELEDRELPDGSFLSFEPNKTEPFTGWRKAYWENGKIRYLKQYKNGRLNGELFYWWKNGDMSEQKKMIEGKANGLWMSWYKNGQRELEQIVVEGKLNGPARRWYQNGQKKDESNYKDGKIISIIVWQPNGQKCPFTNIKDGNGTWVRYNDDGSEYWRSKYRNGIFMLD